MDETCRMKITPPLYRYRSLANDDLIKFVKKTLLDHELYFAQPNSFNDPFDCQPSFEGEPTEYNYNTYLTQMDSTSNKTNSPWPLPVELVKKIRSNYVEGHDLARGVFRVVCMSEVSNNILMWSHYGDNHKGVCLKFDGKHSFFKDFVPVEYTDERVVFPLLSHDTDLVIRSALIKSVQWGYEKEWRTIKYPGMSNPYEESGIYHFEPEALVGVILGPLISEKHEALIRGICAERQPPLEVTRAQLSKSKFAVIVPES